MFNFFTKKNFLIDYLEGFADIHNHLLPGIDDGAKSVEDSIELIKGFGEFGVSDFICTPHIMENYHPNTPATISNSFALLQNGLKMNNLNHVNIDMAAEHMIDSNFENILEKDEVMPLDKRYLLIEMSYLQPSLNLLTAVEKIADKNLYPILAHPERYAFLHGKTRTYQEYKDKGMLMQLNILSLSNYYGKEVQKSALSLLDSGLLDFISSDVHNARQLKAIREIQLSTSLIAKVEPLIQKTAYNFRG